jgi:hypothetical protein
VFAVPRETRQQPLLYLSYGVVERPAPPAANDWLALYSSGADDTSFITWMYVSCSKTIGGSGASGSCPFVVPAATAPGIYEIRLFDSGQYSLLAASNAFTVQ